MTNPESVRSHGSGGATNRHATEASTGQTRVMRWALAFGVVTLFVGVARFAQPRQSAASPPDAGEVGVLKAGGQGGRAAAAPVTRAARTGGVPMGELIGREYLVRIVATDEGSRYTVCTLEGTVLESELEADEVYRFFPGLDVQTLRFGPDGVGRTGGALPGPLMLAEPRESID